MALDPNNVDVKALATAVQSAVATFGPLATSVLLAGHVTAVGKIQASNDYPCTIYGPSGASRVVQSKVEETALGAGWSRVPADAHRTRAGSAAVAATNEAIAAELKVKRAAAKNNAADSSVAGAIASETLIGANGATFSPTPKGP